VWNVTSCYLWDFTPKGGSDDTMDEILQRFLEKAPVAVMAHATLARTIADSVLDDIFRRNSGDQYTRELTFSTVVRLMTQVVFCTYPSLHSASRDTNALPVSITSVYNKLNGLEPGVSQALVAETACAMGEVIAALPDTPAEPIKGLRLRTLDGNALAGTDHRLACLRGSGAAALPGITLVVRDSRTGLLTDIVPCEDAYTSERTLYTAVLPLVAAGDLWLADRNFCTDDYFRGIDARKAFFLIRHHAGSKLHPLGPESRRRSHPDGTIGEQRVRIGMLECRCVLIRLKAPLRDGTTEIRLLTNASPKLLSAARASELYRTRWKIESAFQELTESLRCEINTLGYPRAALFGFALAVMAYNLLVVTRAALASGLGEEVGGVEALSSYHMASQVAAVAEGMSIAVPPTAWERFMEMTAQEFAAWLHETARVIDWRRYRKNPRGPKKPVVVKRTTRGAHRSTAQELIQSQE
jgi:IS4 transposase